jgi:hypothetical protein
MITHVGGLDSVAETTINLDKIPGGKKLVYTHKKLPLAAIADFAEKGRTNKAGRPGEADRPGETGLGEFYAALAEICGRHRGLWNKEAEDYLLANAPEI